MTIEANGPGAAALGSADRAAATAAIRAVLRVTQDDEAALIEAMADTAFGLAEQFLGQALIVRTCRERLPATTGWQRLGSMPVRSITAVAGLASDGTATVLPVVGYEIDIDARGDGWVRIVDAGGATRVEVTSEAGVAADWAGQLLNAAMSLANASDAAINGGANLALIGDELVQFARAEPLGDGRWRLSRLLRGRRGTEMARGGHIVGERFVLIDPATLATTDLPLSAIGTDVRVLASGIGDTAGPVAGHAAIAGTSILPPAPVHLRLHRDGGGLVLRWARRSRAGWRWIDGGDVPLVEEREAYRVTRMPPGGESVVVETDVASLLLAASETPPGTVVSVCQLGTNGQSPAAGITIG
ncbi:MAG: hypothetical protein K2P79_08125 [Sphingomonas sp.]|nr:hypothetical protein [Sphingomonas sp.]